MQIEQCGQKTNRAREIGRRKEGPMSLGTCGTGWAHMRGEEGYIQRTRGSVPFGVSIRFRKRVSHKHEESSQTSITR